MRNPGFSIAELLIALLILGEIAAFTIPKIISAQQRSQSAAKAKEVAGMIAGAYQQYARSNQITTTTTAGVFTQYMNYTSIATTGQLDDIPPWNAVYDCSSNVTCLRLHNGGMLFTRNSGRYYGTSTSHMVDYFFDPDGIRTGLAADGPGKTVIFTVFANGRISSVGAGSSGAMVDDVGDNLTGVAGSNWDPSWFSW